LEIISIFRRAAAVVAAKTWGGRRVQGGGASAINTWASTRPGGTVLSERLQALVFIGAIARADGPHGPEYDLTEAGQELASLVSALGTWGQRWLAREPANEDLDLEPLLVDMQRRVRFTALPKEPFVVRFEVRGHHRRFMLLKKAEASLCHRKQKVAITASFETTGLIGWMVAALNFPRP
jgi:HxlR-like helix-turn-helix